MSRSFLTHTNIIRLKNKKSKQELKFQVFILAQFSWFLRLKFEYCHFLHGSLKRWKLCTELDWQLENIGEFVLDPMPKNNHASGRYKYLTMSVGVHVWYSYNSVIECGGLHWFEVHDTSRIECRCWETIWLNTLTKSCCKAIDIISYEYDYILICINYTSEVLRKGLELFLWNIFTLTGMPHIIGW